LWWIERDAHAIDVFGDFTHRLDEGEIRPVRAAFDKDRKLDYWRTSIPLKDFFRVARERGDCWPPFVGKINEPTWDAEERTETRGSNPVGRPTYIEMSLAIFRRRRKEGIAPEPTLKAEAEAVIDSWPKDQAATRPEGATVENHIRDEYHKAPKDAGL
jgi:hypothetical protein